jgi:hypothetical protein
VFPDLAFRRWESRPIRPRNSIETHHTDEGDITHFIVRVGDQLYEICLCPAAFLKSMDFDFAQGDKWEITGSKAKLEASM